MKALLRKMDFSRELFDRPLESYSEGQKKKVLLGGSLCQRAHLYVWDEHLFQNADRGADTQMEAHPSVCGT
jgi:ATPase subunit of ABC transporter with duplicated ATPase domains